MSQPFRPVALAAVAFVATLICQPAAAQSAEAARSAVRKALQTQPEVLARLNAYLARTEAVDVARAGWLPRVDFNADVGSDRSKDKNVAGSNTISRGGAGVVVSQVLWDGLATRHNVNRAGHDRMTRWFEFIDASETTAFEAVRAVYDVQRQRKLVALAEDNLTQHRQAAEKIEQRVRAGVGRGVDLDQAQARVALAESNLDTEMSNLHDVAVRYQRVIGETPPADMGALEVLRQGLPTSQSEAINTALAKSPVIAASIENLRAARAQASGRSSAFQPKVEARARVGGGRNYTGLENRQAEGAVELVMNWNLFNGGADAAGMREQQKLLQQAMDLRDKACRDVRQNVAVAFNEAQKLQAQLAVLARNATSIERARDAYRQQFEIGQRSLLDLLNAENEAFTARRALTNALYDRAVAHARTLSTMSQLTVQLDIARDTLPKDGSGWSAGSDGPAQCPAQPVDLNALRAGLSVEPLGAAVAASGLAPVAAQAPAPVLAQPAAPAGDARRWNAPPAAAPRGAAAAAPRGTAMAPAEPQPVAVRSVAADPDAARSGWRHPAGNAPIAVNPRDVPAARSAAVEAAVAAGALAPRAMPVAAAAPAAQRAEAGDPAAATVASLVNVWARAQEQRDLKRFSSLYIPGYAGEAGTAARWMAQQREMFASTGPLDVRVSDVMAQSVSDNEVETRFRHTEVVDGQARVVDRVMLWKQVMGRWRISREAVL